MARKVFPTLVLIVNIITLILQLSAMGKWFDFEFLWILPLLCPLLSIINLAFLLYWIIRVKWPFLLFVFVFLVTIEDWGLLLQLPDGEENSQEGSKIMSYNVRLFNQFNWIADPEIPSKILKQINGLDPDVVCLQEYSQKLSPEFSNYPYQYFEPTVLGGDVGNAILSKTPFIESGKIEFKNSTSGGIYADLNLGEKRVRILSSHFESLSTNFKETIDQWNQKKIEFERLKDVLDIQNQQVKLVDSVARSTQFPVVICMDLNNNAFSSPYQKLIKDRKDAFVEAGIGLGSTYKELLFPLRIDFIIVSQNIEVLDFQTPNVHYSDHRPVVAILAN